MGLGVWDERRGMPGAKGNTKLTKGHCCHVHAMLPFWNCLGIFILGGKKLFTGGSWGQGIGRVLLSWNAMKWGGAPGLSTGGSLVTQGYSRSEWSFGDILGLSSAWLSYGRWRRLGGRETHQGGGSPKAMLLCLPRSNSSTCNYKTVGR